MCWNPLLVHCKSFLSLVDILLKTSIKGITEVFSIINCYGPYSHRTIFWDNVFAGGLFSLPNLLMAWDLKFTLSSSEIWGTRARPDPLSSYFYQLITRNNLVDLNMCAPILTWSSNGRVGDDGVRQRLNCFLIFDHLLPTLSCFRTWAMPLNVSDHYPIFLEWGRNLTSQCYRFKFNRAWLLEDDFSSLVNSSWMAPLTMGPLTHLDSFSLKLGRLKGSVKRWERKVQ